MAEIKRIDGTSLEVEPSNRNKNIEKKLQDLLNMNERGELGCFAYFYTTPSNHTGNNWIWDSTPYITTSTLLGAIEVFKAELLKDLLDANEQE